MLDHYSTENILFLDIETAPQVASFKELPEQWKKLFDKKTEFKRKDEPVSEYYRSAGIYAEFGKIICICCGYFANTSGKKQFRVKSFAGDDEKKLLMDFAALLKKHFSTKKSNLCAHNGKEFDFPFIARRMLVHGLKLPPLLNIAGKKPWEVQFLDTMDLWRFGDYKNFTSLELLAATFDIPTPKDDIDGSMIYQVYWQEKNLERIIRYCRKDVVTIARLFQKFKGENMLSEKEIVMVD